MSKRPPDRRRQPRQSRARATEEAIVEAAARVFVADGLAKATTNRIAEVAGVSVGSLYQYFPNKQALTTALFIRESTRFQHILLDLVAELGLDDVPALVRAFIARTVTIFESEGALYRVLFDEVPRASGLAPSLEIDAQAVARLRLLLEAGRRRFAVHDLDTAATLIVRTYRYTTLPILVEPFASEAARESFIDELTAMIVHYLFRERPATEH